MDWKKMKEKLERDDIDHNPHYDNMVRPVLLEIIEYLESKDLIKRISCLER